MEQLSPTPCGCNSKEEGVAPYEPRTHVNLRLTFSSPIQLEEILKIIDTLPKHELTGFEISKW